MTIELTPFTIDVDGAALQDLSRRLANVRWPDASPRPAWEEGTDLDYLRELVAYWKDGFDWRSREAELNAIPQFMTEIDGLTVHLLHQRGVGPRPFPLLLGHGWPGTPFDLRRIIPLLADPGSHGGDPADAFDVVVPSLPGYGFSQCPDRPGFGPERVASGWAELMSRLGHERFGVQAGDWGAAVAMWLAAGSPERVVGTQLNFVPGFFRPPLGEGQPPVPEQEQQFLDRMSDWFDAEGGYHRLQSTRPQTPAYALTDSPVGLAAWLVEKLRGWSDWSCSVEDVFSRDDILTTVSLFWFTGTIGSSMRFYRENSLRPNHFSSGQRVQPPLGMAAFPGDPNPPRSWLERVFDVTRYTTLSHGGHFGPWEEPAALAAEIREFFRPLRDSLDAS